MPFFAFRLLFRLESYCFLCVSLVTVELTLARSLHDTSLITSIDDRAHVMGTQHNEIYEIIPSMSTQNLEKESRNLDSAPHLGAAHELTEERKPSYRPGAAGNREALARDALVVLEALVEEALAAEHEKMSSPTKDFDEFECGDNVSSLAGKLLHESFFLQEKVIERLERFIEEYAVLHSSSRWSVFSSRYREDLDTQLIPLLRAFTVADTTATQPTTPHKHLFTRTQQTNAAHTSAQPSKLKFSEKLPELHLKSVNDDHPHQRVAREGSDKAQSDLVTPPSIQMSLSVPLAEMLSRHLSQVYLTTAALEHVMLGDALAGEDLLLGSLQKVLSEMSRLSAHLKKCVKICGREPPQRAIREVLASKFKRVNYDGRQAAAVRTLRHTLKMIKYFRENFLQLQERQNRKFFASLMPDLIF